MLCTYNTSFKFINRMIEKKDWYRSEKIVTPVIYYLTMIGWFLSRKNFTIINKCCLHEEY